MDPDFELGIKTVFCSENQDSMDRIIDFVSGLKNIKKHTMSLIRGNLRMRTKIEWTIACISKPLQDSRET